MEVENQLEAESREWRAAMEAASVDAALAPLQPTGACSSILFCEAALAIAANPGRYGVDPADALQAARMYYAQ